MKNKTSRMTKCFMFLSIFILIAIVGFNFYQKIYNTPKKFFIEAITSLKNDYQDIYNIKNTNYEFLKNDFTYKGNLNINIEPKILDIINLNNAQKNIMDKIDYLNDLKIEYILSKNDDEILLELNNQYEDNNLNISYYINDNKHYFKLNQFSDYYIQINNLFDIFKNKVLYIDDQKYLINLILHSFISNLKDKYFNTTNETIILNNEEINTKKNILILDSKNITEILNNLIIDLKEDEKAKEIIKNIYSNFDELKINLINDLTNEITIYFNTYTYNNKLIKYEIEFTGVDSILDLNINNLTISFIKDNNIIELYADKKRIAHVTFNNNDDIKNAEIYINDSKVTEVVTSNSNNKKDLSIKIGLLSNNNFNFNLSEIFDENILEEYDKLEDKLLLDCNFIGIPLLKSEITNTAQIYDKSNINLSIDEPKNISDLNKNDYEKILYIIKNFIKI